MAATREPDWMDRYLLEDDELTDSRSAAPTGNSWTSTTLPIRNANASQRRPEIPRQVVPVPRLPQLNPFADSPPSPDLVTIESNMASNPPRSLRRSLQPVQNIERPVQPPHRAIREPNAVTPAANERVVIAIDYGTTYTGFAIAKVRSNHADLNDIEVLQNWGTNGTNNMTKVRTMICYIVDASGKPETLWGSAISDRVTAMVNTKLELEPQTNRFDELELTWYLLRGTGNLAFQHLKKIGRNPSYPSAPPRQIVQDYLTHIRESAFREGVFPKTDLSQLANTKPPGDIVITVPAKWSQEAIDATYKAVRGAGFNEKVFPTLKDTILVSEPEAASFFAIRDLQGELQADGERLIVGDCFILADAGGGTIDVVSYQVKNTEPHLQLERVTEPDSRKCGSAFVETAFKNWLRNVLGPETYGKLDPLNTSGRISVHTLESGPIRTLVEAFIAQKQAFSRDREEDILLDLPEPLDGLSIENRVREGELTIHRDEMENFFDECVAGAIELMDSQIEKLKESRGRVARNVFLVGGFGASLYLQSHLEEALGYRMGSLRRPAADKSLTAVVQGAVIHGIEKSLYNTVKYLTTAANSFGIHQDSRYCQHGQQLQQKPSDQQSPFEWIIRRGDAVLSTEKRSVFSKDFCIPLRACANSKFDVTIYRYRKRGEDDDAVPEYWVTGSHDVDTVATVRCDVSAMIERDMRTQHTQQSPRNLIIGPFRCNFLLSTSSLQIDILHKKMVIASHEIPLEEGGSSDHLRNEWS